MYSTLVACPPALALIDAALSTKDLLQLSLASKAYKQLITARMLLRVQRFQTTYMQGLVKQYHQVMIMDKQQADQPKKSQETKQQHEPHPEPDQPKKSHEPKQTQQTQKAARTKRKNLKVREVRLSENTCAYKAHVKDLSKSFFANAAWHPISFECAVPYFDGSDLADSLKNFNLFFLNHDNSLLLTVNRSLIDPGLNHEQIESNDPEGRVFLAELAESNEFRVTADMSMQDLLYRQKQILQQYSQSQQRVQERQAFTEQPNLKFLYNLSQYAIILCHGGYFAIGVFDDAGRCTFHKSDHKYVKRGKQGQRQINKDSNAGSQVKSMGSQIRRDQEKKHQAKVSSILLEAYPILEQCELLFLQAPGINTQLLVQEAEPLYKLRHKLRSICMTARKANYTEVERVHASINKVWIVVRGTNQEPQFF